MRHLLSDLRFALRAWRNHPGFTAVAILSMALGIGANTAIFTLVDQVLLRQLPVKDPQQLVQLTMDGMHFGSNWGDIDVGEATHVFVPMMMKAKVTPGWDARFHRL